MKRFPNPSLQVFAVLVAAMALAAGCGESSSRLSGVRVAAPTANSPINAVKLLAWQWSHRDTSGYRDLFAAGYRFVFEEADSAGNASTLRTLDRDQEVRVVENLFVRGTSTEPPAWRISFALDPNPIALPDSRPGKNSFWHREIASGLDAVITASLETYRIVGATRFYVVRGDSSGLTGAAADSARWYIERWEDESSPIPAAAARSQAARNVSLGYIKTLYLGP